MGWLIRPIEKGEDHPKSFEINYQATSVVLRAGILDHGRIKKRRVMACWKSHSFTDGIADRFISKRYQLDTIHEKRSSARINHKATIMIETRDGRNFHYGTMYNFSGDGMYFGSDYALKPGMVITIRFEIQPFKYTPKIYIGKVQRFERCEELGSTSNPHLYGLGIRIIEAVYG